MTDLMTDAWIPLGDVGAPRFVSLAALLAGDDAPEIAHPEPELRAWCRMLLAALVQVVAPCATPEALRAQLDAPMRPDDVARGLARVAPAPLLGDAPRFLQAPAATVEMTGENLTSKLCFDRSTTYGNTLRARPVDGLCPSCAAVALYGAQAFAPQGGRGYSPGVRGSSPLTTLLVVPGSVRASAFANTVVPSSHVGTWPDDPPEVPWHFARTVKEGDAIGLVEGLFWTPRALRLDAWTGGVCALCGREGPRVRVTSFASGAKVAGGFYRHPWTPWRRVKGERRHQTTPARPSWSALARWVPGAPVDDDARDATYPATVVTQWVETLGRALADVEILLYGPRFDQTKWLGTVCERHTVGVVAWRDARGAEADAARLALLGALRTATRGRGRVLEEIESRFGAAVTEAFEDARRTGSTELFTARVRKAALALFDESTRSDFASVTRAEPAAQARVQLLAGIRKAFAPSTKDEAPDA